MYICGTFMMIGLLMVSAMMIRLAMRGLQFGDY